MTMMNSVTTTSSSNMASSSGSSGTATTGGPAKAISRHLQHSILQLCNEHIAYSHKLQILGVLCMTVDDEQHELVVKVNNTLKRVTPQPGQKDSQDAAPPPPVPSHSSTGNGPVALYNNNNNATSSAAAASSSSSAFSLPNPLVASGPGYATESVNVGEGSTTPVSPVPASITPVSTTTPFSNTPSPVEHGSRKSHGRKRSKPMRVDHVYDEGGAIEEGDGDILTVIPTDPDNPHDHTVHVQPVFPDDPSDEDDDQVMDDDDDDEEESLPPPKVTSPRRRAHPRKTAKSTASANVRALLQQSIVRKGSSSEGPAASSLSSQQQHSQLRSALLNTGTCLTLPICVAPQERRPGLSNGDVHNARDDQESSGQLHIAEEEEESQQPKDGADNGPLDDSGVNVKEEPRDEYDWSRAGQVTEALSLPSSAQFTSTPFYAIASPGMEGMPSLPTYSGLSLALTTANLQVASSSSSPASSTAQHDGLSIRYTPTGPITVGANGKNVSQPPTSSAGASHKVKDIIMYDDQSPLSQQKGARLETDFMVDKMGVEGRKRRRRSPDETLTTEEIGEYMGACGGMDLEIGRGLFKCKYCPVEVNELVAYLQHTLAVHNAYICHQCGKSFTTKSSLLRHRPIHTGMRRFSCSLCQKAFYRKDKCKAHIKRHLGTDGNAECTAIVD